MAWLNDFYDRQTVPPVLPTGWALVALLFAITLLAAPLSRLVPGDTPAQPTAMRLSHWVVTALVPAIVAPLVAIFVDLQTLPVLVADYLAVHLFVFGAVQLGVLAWLGRPWHWPDLFGVVLLLLWAIGAFGLALDIYGAHFWLIPERYGIVAALSVGAVPFMLADAMATHGAPLWQRIGSRVAFLLSLVAAVALDFERLFFLIMIAPVIVLFFLTFGVMGRAFSQRTGSATAGLALGLVLAWALGVTFPLFAA